MILLTSIAVGAFVSWALFSLFFEDLDELLGCIRYYFTPDFVSFLRGESCDDFWAEFKLFWYIGLSVGGGVATYYGLHAWFAK